MTMLFKWFTDLWAVYGQFCSILIYIFRIVPPLVFEKAEAVSPVSFLNPKEPLNSIYWLSPFLTSVSMSFGII